MADEKIVTDDPKKVIEEDPEASKNKDPESDEEPEITPEPEVPVRNATLQHIIARKNEKIKNLQAKADEDKEGAEDDEELTPEAKTAVQREIERSMAPFRENAINQETERLMIELYQEEPEAKSFDKLIRKYISFEKNGVRPYEHVPPSVIYHDLAFGQAEATGAGKKTAADTQAKLSHTKGRGNRPTTTKTESGLPSIDEMKGMDDKAFQKMMNSKINI